MPWAGARISKLTDWTSSDDNLLSHMGKKMISIEFSQVDHGYLKMTEYI